MSNELSVSTKATCKAWGGRRLKVTKESPLRGSVQVHPNLDGAGAGIELELARRGVPSAVPDVVEASEGIGNGLTRVGDRRALVDLQIGDHKRAAGVRVDRGLCIDCDGDAVARVGEALDAHRAGGIRWRVDVAISSRSITGIERVRDNSVGKTRSAWRGGHGASALAVRTGEAHPPGAKALCLNARFAAIRARVGEGSATIESVADDLRPVAAGPEHRAVRAVGFIDRWAKRRCIGNRRPSRSGAELLIRQQQALGARELFGEVSELCRGWGLDHVGAAVGTRIVSIELNPVHAATPRVWDPGHAVLRHEARDLACSITATRRGRTGQFREPEVARGLVVEHSVVRTGRGDSAP